MDIRPADDGDLQGIAAARLSNGPAHHDSGANADYCRFLMGCGHLWVAVEGEVIGFGGAVDIGSARLLSDLYVRNDAHGRGVGSALRRAVLDGAASTFTFASSEPSAQAIYARAGMAATWPLLTFHGTVEATVGLGGDTLQAVAVDLDRAVDVELDLTGTSHRDVLSYWAGRDGNRLLELRDGTVTCGLAVVHTDADGVRIEHLAVDDAIAAAAFRTAVAAVVDAPASATAAVEAYVPAVRALSGQLAEAGFEVVDTSMFMTSAQGVVSDVLQVLHPGLC